jgi:glycosyltransferase involved in cell wall biosynthesis
MPVYNGEGFLAAAIGSVLGQSHGNLELLVLDDGSTDDSAAIARSFGDPRVRLIRNGSNRGIILTRNRGIREARGAFIAFLDCDDIALPERLAVQFGFLRDNPDFVMVGSWIALMDERGDLTGAFSRYVTAPGAIPAAMLFDNCFAQSAVMVRREALLKEPYREEYPCAEDYDLFARLTLTGKSGNIPRVLTLYREHVGGMSKVRRDLIVRCTQAVHAWQLERLGIAAAPEELRLHGALGCFAADLPGCDLSNVAAWLTRLYRANGERSLYPRQEFVSLLLEKMALACATHPAPLMALARHYPPFPGAGAVTRLGVLLAICRRNLTKRLFALSLGHRKEICRAR